MAPQQHPTPHTSPSYLHTPKRDPKNATDQSSGTPHTEPDGIPFCVLVHVVHTRRPERVQRQQPVADHQLLVVVADCADLREPLDHDRDAHDGLEIADADEELFEFLLGVWTKFKIFGFDVAVGGG